MPQLQVINRVEDPIAKQLGEAGTDVAAVIQKQQALKLTGQYYKIQAKNAQTEQDKFRFERLAKLNSDILPQIAATKDPATKAMLMKGVVDSGMYEGDAKSFYHDIADSHEQIQSNHQNIAGSLDQMNATEDSYATPGQLAGAQAGNLAAEGSLNRIKAAAMADPAGYMAKMGAGMATLGAPAMQDSDTEGVSNTPVFTGGTVNTALGDMQFSNPAADAAKARATTIGTQTGTKMVELKPAVSSLDDYLANLDAANKEIGGTSERSVTARARALAGNVTAPFKRNSVLPALNAKRLQTADMISTLVNAGRSAAFKIDITHDLMPGPEDSTATQKLKTAGLRRIMEIGTTRGTGATAGADPAVNAVSDLKSMLSKDQVFVNKLRAQHVPESEINSRLEKIHRSKGY